MKENTTRILAVLLILLAVSTKLFPEIYEDSKMKMIRFYLGGFLCGALITDIIIKRKNREMIIILLLLVAVTVMLFIN